MNDDLFAMLVASFEEAIAGNVKIVRMGEGAIQNAKDILPQEWIDQFAATPYDDGCDDA